MKAGEYQLSEQPILINAGRSVQTVTVTNTGDRPITSNYPSSKKI